MRATEQQEGSAVRPERERVWGFTAEGPSVHSARTYLVDALTEWGYPPSAIDDALMVVSELAGNAVRYGEGGRYYVRARSNAGFLAFGQPPE